MEEINVEGNRRRRSGERFSWKEKLVIRVIEGASRADILLFIA